MSAMNPHGWQSATPPELISESMPGQETLTLVSGLPAPDGLATRIKQRLESRLEAEVRLPARGARLLAWPATETRWRAAAIAAGLLMAVAAGGAAAYHWVAPAPLAHTAPATARPSVKQGFATAGAMRTPVTVVGPQVPVADRQTMGVAKAMPVATLPPVKRR